MCKELLGTKVASMAPHDLRNGMRSPCASVCFRICSVSLRCCVWFEHTGVVDGPRHPPRLRLDLLLSVLSSLSWSSPLSSSISFSSPLAGCPHLLLAREIMMLHVFRAFAGHLENLPVGQSYLSYVSHHSHSLVPMYCEHVTDQDVAERHFDCEGVPGAFAGRAVNYIDRGCPAAVKQLKVTKCTFIASTRVGEAIEGNERRRV